MTDRIEGGDCVNAKFNPGIDTNTQREIESLY